MSIATHYPQYCPVARALEVIGERWTALVARELLLGPRRFTDLLAGLPGISTNLLTERLKDLEQAGLVARRTLPPPAASTVYELTAASAGLTHVLAAMAQWGEQMLGAPRADDDVRPAWLLLGRAVAAAEAPDLADAVYELHVDGETFHVQVEDGRFRPAHGAAPNPDATITASAAALLAAGRGDRDPFRRRGRADLRIEGDTSGARAFLGAFAGRA